MQDVLDAQDYAVVLANSDWDAQREHRLLAMARRNRFDRIIINPVSIANDELAAGGIPVVVLGLHAEYPDFDAVGLAVGDALGDLGRDDAHRQRYGIVTELYKGAKSTDDTEFAQACLDDSYSD